MHAFAADYDVKYNGFYYKITDETNKYCELVAPPSGSYSIDTLKIARLIKYNNKNYSVRSIGEKAFYECKTLKHIRDVYSLNSIGNYAFYGCTSLRTALLSASQIDVMAFGECSSLKYVAMYSIKTIDTRAFYNCSALTAVLCGRSLELIGQNAFENCNNLKTMFCLAPQPFKLSLPNADALPQCTTTFVVPYQYIDNYKASFNAWTNKGNITHTFVANTDFVGQKKETTYVLWNEYRLYGDYIEAPKLVLAYTNSYYSASKLVVPDVLNYESSEAIFFTPAMIAEEAFAKNSALKPETPNYVTIGPNIEQIAQNAFCAYKMKSFTVSNANNYYSTDDNGVLFNKDKSILMCYTGGVDKKSYVIPSSVTIIGKKAFSASMYLNHVIFNPGLVNICEGAFSGCWYLQSLDLPEGLKHIQANAFRTTMELSVIKLPSTLLSIGDYAFEGYEGNADDVEDVYCYAKEIPTAFSNAFDRYTLKATLHVPVGTGSKYRSNTPWSKFNNIVEDLDANAYKGIREDVNEDGQVNSLDVLKVYKYMQSH